MYIYVYTGDSVYVRQHQQDCCHLKREEVLLTAIAALCLSMTVFHQAAAGHWARVSSMSRPCPWTPHVACRALIVRAFSMVL